MTTLANSPTKAEEIETLDKFIADQAPDSYLRDIMGGLRIAIITAIRNDIGFIDYNPHEQQRFRGELEEQILALRKELAGLTDELAAKRLRLDRLNQEREQLAESFSQISQAACSALVSLKKQ